MNNIISLLEDEFFLMFIPTFDLLNNASHYKLKYSYPNMFQNADAYKIEVSTSNADVQFYKEQLNNNKIVILENRIGSFVFSNVFTFDIFQILQKHYKEYTNYVFCADKDFGYFKILENGKIKRKINSFGFIKGISIYPETRGVPCQYEIDNNVTFKIDSKAKLLVEMLKGFGREEVIDLIDYYIGISIISNGDINKTHIYEIR
ncbi:MAG: hypothetical protein E7411_04375 [Ruminococcaceae bacterium]|nr:hypothetical protein [Oscillospiraceae bacterium]